MCWLISVLFKHCGSIALRGPSGKRHRQGGRLLAKSVWRRSCMARAAYNIPSTDCLVSVCVAARCGSWNVGMQIYVRAAPVNAMVAANTTSDIRCVPALYVACICCTLYRYRRCWKTPDARAVRSMMIDVASVPTQRVVGILAERIAHALPSRIFELMSLWPAIRPAPGESPVEWGMLSRSLGGKVDRTAVWDS